MQIQPIVSALRKHRLATLLIALEVALACAVLCNACFLVANRLAAMNIDSGVDETALGTVRINGFVPPLAVDLNARMLAGLGAIPGVQSVSLLSAVPFGAQTGTAGIMLDAAGKRFGGVVDFYLGGPGAFQSLGLRLASGRAPQAEDYQPVATFLPAQASVWVTRALAAHLWPDADPLGRELWLGKFHYRVVGLLDHLAIAQPGSRGVESADWSVFVPTLPGSGFAGNYLLRAKPQDLNRVMRDATAAVAKIAPDVVLDPEQSRSIGDLRETFFQTDRAMVGLLLGVIVALLLVTALGILGLASFWVAQRRRQIGIRRAVGATRTDILRYFQVENFLIVSLGIALGVVLTFAINLTLMKFFELPRLPLYYLPIGALGLWGLGQLAVLGPALRAAAVPPVVATRSV